VYPSACIATADRACAPVCVNDYSTMGARLRALREEARLSREDVASIAGVRGQTIYKYETDEIAVGAEALIAISERFKTDPRWILRGDPEDGPVLEAFAEFERTIAPTLRPPLTIGERGKLIWTRHHNPRPEKYLADLIREREGETPAEAAASAAAMTEATTKGRAWSVPAKSRRHRGGGT
jgi:transcriptional regulator with XRE-family HTH domain